MNPMTGNPGNIIDEYHKESVEREDIPQDKLNLSSNRRTNPFRYRGQFSPDLVSRLIKKYSDEGDSIYDPFLGCGTTIYESIKLKRHCFGSEINPAGILMAGLIGFADKSPKEYKAIRDKAVSIANSIIEPSQAKLGGTNVDSNKSKPFEDRIVDAVDEIDDRLARSLLINAFLEWSYGSDSPPKEFLNELKVFCKFSESITGKKGMQHEVFHRDSRFTPLSTNSIDLVLTSPPYINVHNYHQHHRDSIEQLGWEVLESAKSEFGSNRKNRQNRFKTVVQFLIDIHQLFLELSRIIKDEGKAILVVGRTSTIRGVEFNNGEVITGAALLSGFELQKRQERHYQNNFGTEVYEDILHFTMQSTTGINTQIRPEEFGKHLLKQKLNADEFEKNGVESDIRGAVNSNPPQPSKVLYSSKHTD